MEEMSEQDRQARAAKFAKRTRIAEGIARIVHVLVALFWLLVFVTAVRTGYLSWIGLTVGAAFVASMMLFPILGWAGRKHLELVLLGVHFGMVALALIVGLWTFYGPQDKNTGRSYRFDDELTALEGRRAVPDAENAASRYEAVFANLDLADEPNFVFTGICLRDELGQHPWKANEHPQASTWLDSQSRIIDGLLPIGRMEKCRWPVRADTYDERTVPYRKLRRSMLLLLAAGNRDLGERRVTDALTKYFCTLRIADHLHQQPSMVDTLTGFGYERDILRMIRQLLVQGDLSEENIGEIGRHLPPAADPWSEEWGRLLEHEKLHYMNLLGRLYEVGDNGDVRFASDPVISPRDRDRQGGLPRLYWLMSMPRDPHAVRGLVDRYFAEFDRKVNSPRLPQAGKDSRAARASRNGCGKTLCNYYRWWAEVCFFNEDTYVRHRQWRVPAITQRRGTWLTWGLRRYRDTHGLWPRALDAISEYVPAEAFFDPTAEEPFVYTPDGDSFRLYSKGPNHIDEGGRDRYVKALDKVEDDIWIWPPPAPEPEDNLTDDEMLKLMEKIYGKDYMNYMKDQGSDKR